MHTGNRDSRSERLRERALRRAIEMVELSGDGAGTRVTEIVRHRLADGSQRIVIVDDALDSSRELVEHAFDALRYSALVCAPGADGEIVLLGMSQLHDDLLAAIPWGTTSAFDGLLSAARERHVSVMLLPALEIAPFDRAS